jgi:hypothetical protein
MSTTTTTTNKRKASQSIGFDELIQKYEKIHWEGKWFYVDGDLEDHLNDDHIWSALPKLKRKVDPGYKEYFKGPGSSKKSTRLSFLKKSINEWHETQRVNKIYHYSNRTYGLASRPIKVSMVVVNDDLHWESFRCEKRTDLVFPLTCNGPILDTFVAENNLKDPHVFWLLDDAECKRVLWLNSGSGGYHLRQGKGGWDEQCKKFVWNNATVQGSSSGSGSGSSSGSSSGSGSGSSSGSSSGSGSVNQEQKKES